MAADNDVDVLTLILAGAECLHCEFCDLAEEMIEDGDHDPNHVIRQMAGALADIIAGLKDEKERKTAIDEVIAALPTLVAEGVKARDDDEVRDAMARTVHKPGRA